MDASNKAEDQLMSRRITTEVERALKKVLRALEEENETLKEANRQLVAFIEQQEIKTK